MLDGERSYVRSESPQNCTYAHTRVYGTRPRRGRSHADASESLASNLDLYYFIKFKVFKFNSTLTNLPNTNVNPVTLVRPM